MSLFSIGWSTALLRTSAASVFAAGFALAGAYHFVAIAEASDEKKR